MYNETTIGHGLGRAIPSKILAWGLGPDGGVVIRTWTHVSLYQRGFVYEVPSNTTLYAITPFAGVVLTVGGLISNGFESLSVKRGYEHYITTRSADGFVNIRRTVEPMPREMESVSSKRGLESTFQNRRIENRPVFKVEVN